MQYGPVADRISRDRFRKLQRYLHFVDNSTIIPRGQKGHNRLGKVRPILTYITQKCKEVYSPHKEVTVDEAMIKFQGRSSLKQYLPMKPASRCGFSEMPKMATSRTCQYTLGRRGIKSEEGLSTKVVKNLTTELKGLHHHAYNDNYFTSLSLIEDLLKDGIYACGVARKDRKYFPPQLSEAKLKQR